MALMSGALTFFGVAFYTTKMSIVDQHTCVSRIVCTDPSSRPRTRTELKYVPFLQKNHQKVCMCVCVCACVCVCV